MLIKGQILCIQYWFSLSLSITTMPIVVKGILRADDAELAIHHGVAAIAVSNHGARQFDGVQATVAYK